MVLYACVSVLSSELQLESHVQSSGLETERVDTTMINTTVRQNTPFIIVSRRTCSKEFIGRLLHSKNFNLELLTTDKKFCY